MTWVGMGEWNEIDSLVFYGGWYSRAKEMERQRERVA